ncbi:DUF3486 family protein [Stagnimonas aquatica]|uniref:DUF3486 family protein n=1 Tax=Stagnimonas aquatica TaxID=2689987 RepID=A0A3N0V7D5_9GAMM|nr:phage protein Gp27 family protein [Stagnimonas aquatica]ROH88633.1 DUF3486 family protein [Stagnimonas aquatica]
MGRKSKVDRLPPDLRERVKEQLADGGPTLDEIREQIAAADVEPPTISSLHRAQQKLRRWADRAREAKAIQEAWIQELGSNPESQVGKLLQETLRLLAYQAADDMREASDAGNPIDVKAFAAISRSFLAIENGARISAERERELIAEGERRARERIDKAGRAVGLTAEQANRLRKELGGGG